MVFYILSLVWCFLLDQVSKFWLENFLKNRIVEITDFFSLVLVYNKGFAFGLGQNWEGLLKEVLYIFFPLLVIIATFFYALRGKNKFVPVALGMIAGGGLGNLWDRIFLHQVRDFFDFHIGNWHYPAFNVADICVSVGIFILLLHFLLKHEDRSDNPSP